MNIKFLVGIKNPEIFWFRIFWNNPKNYKKFGVETILGVKIWGFLIKGFFNKASLIFPQNFENTCVYRFLRSITDIRRKLYYAFCTAWALVGIEIHFGVILRIIQNLWRQKWWILIFSKRFCELFNQAGCVKRAGIRRPN